MTEIATWLDSIGLGHYAAVFDKNDIDMEIVSELSEQDLTSMGVSLGHRKRILKAIAQFDQQSRGNATTTPAVTTEPVQPDPERRHMSLMFCDLADSTRLATLVDLEDMHDINRAFQEACAAAINQFDGFVARYMGDGILAYFGYPVAHEDDAERAVRAGLRISDTVKALGDNLKLPDHEQLSVRIGIATGPVVVEVIGEGASQESAVVGEAPNRAARLQGLADANSVVIDPGTRQLLGGRFELDEMGASKLKGIAEAVEVWRVQGESSVEQRTQSIRNSNRHPMIGRDQELGLLLSRWRLVKQGEGQVILLSGEAGLGKSRICQALMDSTAQDNHTLMRFFCSSYRTQSPLHPFVSHIERECGFLPDDSDIDKQRKLEGLLLENHGYPREALTVIASLLAIELDESYQAPEKNPVAQLALLQDAFIDNLVSRSQGGPVMLIMEDAHWIDPTSKTCLDLLVDKAAEHRIFVVISSRFSSAIGDSNSHVTRLSLRKLSKQQVAYMIDVMTDSGSMDAGTMEKINEKSEGIPLYVEEVTKMMLESRQNRDSESGSGQFAIGVPDTLQASLLSRLDQLGNTKRVAQTASVVGDTFDLDVLAHLCGSDQLEIQPQLELLVENEVIFQHKTAEGLHYRFRHALLRDAAYESLLKRNRARLHREAASYLVEKSGNQTVHIDELVAYHYAEAGDSSNAFRHWLSAGIHALDSGATFEAVELLNSAKKYMPDDSDQREDLVAMYQLQMAHGRALNASLGAASHTAHDSFREAVMISRKLNSIGRQIDALDYQFGITFNAGMLEESLKPAQEMLQIGIENDHLLAMISGYQVLGMAYYALGQFDKARSNLESALDTRGQTITGINSYPSMTMDYLSYVLFITGEPEAARKMCDDAYASALTESDYSTASALSNGCITQMMLGDTETVRRNATDLIVLAEEKGQYMYLNRGLLYKNLAQAILEKDQVCLNYVADVIRTLLESKEEIDATSFLGFTAETQIAFQQYDQARDSLEQAQKIADKNHERYYQAELYRLQAELALARSEKCWRHSVPELINTARELALLQSAGGWLKKIDNTEKLYLEALK